MAMPTIANTMWKASDTAIWERAARRSDMDFKLAAWGGGGGEWGGGLGVPSARPRPPPPPPPPFVFREGGLIVVPQINFWVFLGVCGHLKKPPQKQRRGGL